MNRLHPRIRLLWIVQSIIHAIIVAIAATAAHVFLGIPRWVPIAAFLVVVVLGVVFAVARYRRWGYEVRDDSLYLERGVLTEIRTVVPLVRIQHVDSRRSPFERLTGLASTVVYTAGSRGADVRIPGLTDAGATDLRERLKRLAILAEGEDAV